MKCLTFGLLAASMLAGCSSAYTHIEKNVDGSYLITRNKTVFVPSGTLLSCTAPTETKMVCKEVASP